jgi:peptide/nickel transport system substrate-binding protein
LSLFANAAQEKPATSSNGQKMAADQVYYEAITKASQGESSFVTTTAHRMDSYVNQPGVAMSWNGELKNLIVESYEMQEDGKVWILNIRKDAKWHDGYDVVAEDFIWSYSAWANPRVATRWNGKASSIKGYADVQSGATDVLSGVTKIDDKTVRVELNSAMPLWMRIEQVFLVVYPYHVFKDVKPSDVVAHPYWKARIGTGPFKYTEYVPDQYIKLTRNENYYLGAPILETVYCMIYADAKSMLNAYASGEVHTTFYEGTSIVPQDRDYYKSLPDHVVVTMDKGSNSAIVLNMKDEDWSKLEIRQALMYAVDVDAILTNLYPGALKALDIFPQSWAHGENLNAYDYNPELAKQLVAKAGYSGKTHTLYYAMTDQLVVNILQACQQYWAAVGINVNLQYLDAAGTTALNSSDKIDMLLNGTGMALDPSLAETALKTGEMLAYNYSNEKVDNLFAEGKKYENLEDRKAIYQEISTIINTELPRVWLWADIRDLGFSSKVVGPAEHFREQGSILFNMGVYNEIEKWYVVE